MTVFVDTNILLYTISAKPDDEAKRAIAVEILDRDDAHFRSRF